MINKQSSNDEVLHHLKQMELMLMSDEEEKGLRRILEIEEILSCPKVEYWLDDGVFSSTWLDDTNVLLTDVKNKLLKNYVIKEHLAQCRGFVAYNILLSKLENNDMRLMYQNGQWIFAFLNERREQEAWVNQRFNSCFFNTTYERKFLELIKETPTLEVDKAWLFKRENWFYTSDLFEELNVVFNKLTFEDVDKPKDTSPRILEEEMPPLNDEPIQQVAEPVTPVEVVSTQESVSVEVQSFVAPQVVEPIAETPIQEAVVEVVKPMPVPVKSKVKSDEIPFGVEEDPPFVADEEEMPPLDDINEFDLFKPAVVETQISNEEALTVQEVFVDTQKEPIKVEFDFDGSSTGEVADVFVQEPKQIKAEVVEHASGVVIAPVISNKGISISPIPEKKAPVAPAVAPVNAPSKPRVVFGSKRNVVAQEGSEVKSETAPSASPVKKGFALSLGGKSIKPSVSNDIPFEEMATGTDDE